MKNAKHRNAHYRLLSCRSLCVKRRWEGKKKQEKLLGTIDLILGSEWWEEFRWTSRSTKASLGQGHVAKPVSWAPQVYSYWFLSQTLMLQTVYTSWTTRQAAHFFTILTSMRWNTYSFNVQDFMGIEKRHFLEKEKPVFSGTRLCWGTNWTD